MILSMPDLVFMPKKNLMQVYKKWDLKSWKPRFCEDHPASCTVHFVSLTVVL